MASSIDILAVNAQGIRKYETFIQTCCGPASVLVGAVAEYLKAPFSAVPSMEKSLLDSLDGIGKGIADTHCQFGGDGDMVNRWSGLAALVRAMLDKDDKKGHRSSAVDWFTDLCKSREAANFIVADFLQPGKPLLEERTPVLFDKCDGRVLTLIVEANIGTRRCLAPNFWRIGLVPFPGRGKDGHLPTAIYEAMDTAMAGDVPLRLRWHLEGFRSESLGEPLHGRSVESAAVCAVLAIVERYRDQQRPSDPQEKALRRVNPILDASTVNR